MHRLLAAIPVIIFAFLLIVSPLLGQIHPGVTGFREFFPAVTAITLLLALASLKHLKLGVFRSVSILGFVPFMAFAGASVTWAYMPGVALSRWVFELMVIFSVIVPFAFIEQTGNLIRRLHWCCLISMIISAVYVLTTPPIGDDAGNVVGHPGYFAHKQYLGIYASVTILISLHELKFSGFRRVLSIIAIGLAFWVLMQSKSKMAFGFLLMSPVIAWIVMEAVRRYRLPLILVASVPPAAFLIASSLINLFPYRIAWYLTGDPTFTGRAFIWQWLEGHASMKPWFGWGFHSYFMLGPASPIRQAPGYVGLMNSSHSGYLDVRLETGYVGLMLLFVLIGAAIHGLEHVRRVDPTRAWLLLSLATYAVMANYLDVFWMISYDPFWVLFVIIAAEGARCSQLNRRAFAVSRWSASMTSAGQAGREFAGRGRSAGGSYGAGNRMHPAVQRH